MKSDLAEIIIRDAGGMRAAECDPRFYDTKRLLRRVYSRCAIQLLPTMLTIISPDGEILKNQRVSKAILHSYKSFAAYRDAQETANKEKIENVWALEMNIKFLSRYIKSAPERRRGMTSLDFIILRRKTC